MWRSIVGNLIIVISEDMWTFIVTDRSKDYIIKILKQRYYEWKQVDDRFLITNGDYGVELSFEKRGRNTVITINNWIPLSIMWFDPLRIRSFPKLKKSGEMEKEITEFLKKYEIRSKSKKK